MYKVITVGAGHSERSNGANRNGYKEHEVARVLKDKLIAALRSVGQKTVDCTSDAATKEAVLAEQVRMCNAVNKNGRLDVSIHLNAGGGTGSEVLYYDQKALAAKVSASICKVAGWRDRGAKIRDDLYFLRNTDAPAILIEVCFIDSASDMKILNEKMDAIVNAIAKELTGKNGKVPTPKPVIIKDNSKPVIMNDQNFKIKVKAKELWYYDKPDWNAKKNTVKAGEVFTVVETLTVNGSKMYKLKSGVYLTANPSFVDKI
ncbi:N-acetylmuramoyl-L-alanine amidase [Bacillus oleivorans]|uniref:N-acetylmuramoyl-L-alanine amidase n=1 Tax=Bacillus oleivorans TaxID=1448271 RepID=A0A285CHD5_9BACI|nr:N-acetylmuramoyl-L-alanine amidase [Bacillus oleivorans]SNX67004.1 N-acetylmuramoyl-L-alanine amidase [Bacillus oleivorans]